MVDWLRAIYTIRPASSLNEKNSMRMEIVRVVAGRLVHGALVLAVLSVLIFLFMRAIPGDPVLTILGDNVTAPGQYEKVRVSLGLDLPLYQQYFSWIYLVLHGNFGTSIANQSPVLPQVIEKLKATLELAFFAVLIGTVVGILVGSLAALKRNTAFDFITTIVTLMSISIPVFWLGTVLIIIFAVVFNIAPTGGMASFDTLVTPVTGFPLLDAALTGDWNAVRDHLWHLFLPAITLALAPTALIARTTRASMIEIINEDYVKAGLARGLSHGQVLRRHVLKNALIPVVTIIGLEMSIYIGGSIVTETVFSWPGLGRQIIQAVYSNDYPLVQGAILAYAVLIVLINMVVDIAYLVIDPRVKA